LPDRVLKANVREKTGRRASQRLREEGFIPAVLYGHKEEIIHLSLPRAEMEEFLREGQRTLDINYKGDAEKALIKEIQYDALGTEIIHIDFARIALYERVTVSVEIEPIGEPTGAAEEGVLEQPLHELEVECLASDIPQRLQVEISHLQIGDSISVGDLKLPPGVKALADADQAVFVLQPPAMEEEEEVVPEEVPVEEEAPPEPEAEEEEGKEEGAS
jgi:large subunit ribosomal protein L25